MVQKLEVKSKLNSEEIISEFGKLEDKKYIAVLDLELTCWDESDPNRRPRHEMEIIEIGVVLLDAHTLEQVKTYQAFAKPIYRPQLSEYCTKLTGIAQADVDSTRNLNVVVSIMRDEFLPPERELVWAGWGADSRALQEELVKITYKPSNLYRMDPRFINVKMHHNSKIGKRMGLKQALIASGLPQDLPHHRALPDALSTARIVRSLDLKPIDALVTNERSYRQVLESVKQDRITQILKKYDICPDKAKALLKSQDWETQKVLNILRILEVPKSAHTI